MKNRDSDLILKRTELKQVINEGMEKTFPAYFFNAVGRGLVKVFRLRKQPHWVLNAVVLGVLVFLPGLLISFVTREYLHWREIHLFYVGLVIFAYLAPVVSHINVVYNVLPGIRDHLVDSIESVEDLNKLQSWLNRFWSFRSWMTFIVCAGFLYGIISTAGFSLSSGGFIGVGLTVLTFSAALFYLVPVYVIFFMLTFPPQLAGYRLKLYESDPANSEVIQHLIYILNVYIYVVVGYTAIGTAIIAINPATWWYNYYGIVVAWVPTILQFLVNQYSIRKIIITAKWQNLNRLQGEIKELQNSKLGAAPDKTILRINQLMDLHDRISSKRNSILNWGTGLSFLNQLLLPLLGLLLGNIDKVLNLLTRTP